MTKKPKRPLSRKEFEKVKRKVIKELKGGKAVAEILSPELKKAFEEKTKSLDAFIKQIQKAQVQTASRRRFRDRNPRFHVSCFPED